MANDLSLSSLLIAAANRMSFLPPVVLPPPGHTVISWSQFNGTITVLLSFTHLGNNPKTASKVIRGARAVASALHPHVV